MHRFIIPLGYGSNDTVELNREEAQHALRVLRLSNGAPVEVSDGAGVRFEAELVEASRERVAVRIGKALAPNEPPVELTLFQGMPKADKLEFIVQKATELGVSRIIPVIMERTVIKRSVEDNEKHTVRLRRIALEAAKQCGRARVPEIIAPVSWSGALELCGALDLTVMPWECEKGRSLTGVRDEMPSRTRIGVLVGPEGGIAQNEAETARRAGALAVTLGPRILRTETAALTAVALVMGLWGDMR